LIQLVGADCNPAWVGATPARFSMVDCTMSRDDMPTLVPCLACGGEFRLVFEDENGVYRTHTCRWCTSGAQSPSQIRAWREFTEKRKTDPKIKLT
jgi:hypothetical protein